MLIFDESTIYPISLHKVGVKFLDENIIFSKKTLALNEDIGNLLLRYFVSPFKSSEYFNFYHETDLKYNEVFDYVSAIFENPETLLEQSVNLAKHLYEQSTHPKIKGGIRKMLALTGDI